MEFTLSQSRFYHNKPATALLTPHPYPATGPSYGQGVWAATGPSDKMDYTKTNAHSGREEGKKQFSLSEGRTVFLAQALQRKRPITKKGIICGHRSKYGMLPPAGLPGLVVKSHKG